MSKIKIYTTTWCADCKRTKSWLNDNKIPYEEINIEQDEKAVEYVQKLNNGMNSVPTIEFPDGSILTEPSNAELEKKVKDLHLILDQNTKIIFVYNADSSLFAQITDYAHKVIAPRTYQCNLCKITYDNLGMKQEWREFIQKLPLDVEFLHKDKFVKLYPKMQAASFPAAFKKNNDKISILIISEEINKQHTVKDLENLLLSKVEN